VVGVLPRIRGPAKRDVFPRERVGCETTKREWRLRGGAATDRQVAAGKLVPAVHWYDVFQSA
jgi:hypothetical protein